MVERDLIKNILRASFFAVLMIAYCFFYMAPVLKQYFKGSKTIAYTRESNNQPQPPPVLILCPYPPSKTSFFEHHGMDNALELKNTFGKVHIIGKISKTLHIQPWTFI